MDISVVILSWNDRSYLEECLESLEQGSVSHSLEIIVVDNASTDGSPEMVESKYPRVKLIRNRENLGFPKGNNVGIEASRGKYVCLLNSDIKVLGRCLDILVDYMDEHRDIGMIGPRILNGDRTHQSSCRRFPTLWNNFCVMTGLAKLLPGSKFFSGEHMFYFKGDRELDVEVLVGCFWMVRREAMEKFGLLDEGFFMYAEDVDWCKRCWASGWRITFHPGAESVHYRGGSSAKRDPVWLALTQQRSILRYWKKHHGVTGQVSMSCLIFAHKCARWVAALGSYVMRPSKRKDSLTRMQVSAASMMAILGRSNGGQA
ncbi:glycosyltransferase family 2 protein [Pedosphaera parvula]|uniref:Glycosyl transferase family 2 n=1 Tax=Pedosphaera parvula (strain Ellin514) TaxID=320771 RepID=B9XD38_PEDPL|nr:glycosyltransferase family 2 protein [Pedosphaera parvula]EEF62384.1 glycosyl transferase family 2 [Pedosphaera parvula Ellin514]